MRFTRTAAPLLHYREPDLLGVAMWLPALYACGSLAFGAAGEKVMGQARAGTAGS